MNENVDNTRYLSGTKLASATMKKHVLLLFGGVTSAFWAVALCLSFTDETLKEDFLMILFMLGLSLYLFYRGRVCARQLDAAEHYRAILECDTDGIVTMEELTAQRGKPADKVRAELELLFKKGFFRNCTLNLDNGKCTVILPVKAQQNPVKLVKVTCSLCGAVNNIRSGEAGTCAYCGGSLFGQEEQKP